MSVVNSILMTVFNRSPRVLWNTLHALRKNNLDNCEVVIVDDGSAVDYEEQRAYTAGYGMPVRWERIEPDEYPPDTYTLPHPRGGLTNNPAFAMNRGIEMCRGRRIIFLSSDCMIPDFGIASAKKCGESYWLANVVDQASNIMYVCDRRALPYHFFGSCLRKHIEAIGGFDENFMRGLAWEDADFGTRLSLQCGHVAFDSTVLVVHQSHPAEAYSDNFKGFNTSKAYIEEKWGGVPWLPDDGNPSDPIYHKGFRSGPVWGVNPSIKPGFTQPLNHQFLK